MILIIFGNSNCEQCQFLTRCLDVINIPYDFIDALAADTQSMCDKYDVDALPHAVIEDEYGSIVWQQAKTVELQDIIAHLDIKHAP